MNVGQPLSDHFIDVNKKVELGSGAFREVEDTMLTLAKKNKEISHDFFDERSE